MQTDDRFAQVLKVTLVVAANTMLMSGSTRPISGIFFKLLYQLKKFRKKT